MNNHQQLGWHFVSDTLRDHSPVPKDLVWATLPYRKDFRGKQRKILPCDWGFHASVHPADAAQYISVISGKSTWLCKVLVRGDVTHAGHKFAGRERMILKRMRFEGPMMYFMRMTALRHMKQVRIELPEVVVEFLMTGDLRKAPKAAEAVRGWYYATGGRSVVWELMGFLHPFGHSSDAHRFRYGATGFAENMLGPWEDCLGPGLYGARMSARKEFKLFVEECFR